MKGKTLARRLCEIGFTLISITFLSFCLVYFAPSDAAEKMLRSTGSIPAPETVQALRAKLGLDQPVLSQYLAWLKQLLHGNLGTSFSTGQPVTFSLLPALGRTAQLAGWCFLVTVIVSLPLGVLCAKHQNRLFDKLIRMICYIFTAIPTFVVGIAALYYFAVKRKWLPAVANNSANGLILPIAVLSSVMIVWMIRQVRTIVLEKMSQRYLEGLRARGLSEAKIAFSYVLKDAMIPIVTSLGICLGSMLAGAVLVENIFSWSGLGKIVLNAINYNDYPVIQGFILWISLIYYAINLLIDLFYRIFDPRIRRGNPRQIRQTGAKRRFARPKGGEKV